VESKSKTIILWDWKIGRLEDWKIGIWPIGEYIPVARISVNRPAGTSVWKNQKVNKDKCREQLLEKVIPAIKDNWPRQLWNDNTVVIRIQQDGASAHISPDDEGFNAGLVGGATSTQQDSTLHTTSKIT
jgi:hypothetical protein